MPQRLTFVTGRGHSNNHLKRKMLKQLVPHIFYFSRFCGSEGRPSELGQIAQDGWSRVALLTHLVVDSVSDEETAWGWLGHAPCASGLTQALLCGGAPENNKKARHKAQAFSSLLLAFCVLLSHWPGPKASSESGQGSLPKGLLEGGESYMVISNLSHLVIKPTGLILLIHRFHIDKFTYSLN